MEVPLHATLCIVKQLTYGSLHGVQGYAAGGHGLPDDARGAAASVAGHALQSPRHALPHRPRSPVLQHPAARLHHSFDHWCASAKHCSCVGTAALPRITLCHRLPSHGRCRKCIFALRPLEAYQVTAGTPSQVITWLRLAFCSTGATLAYVSLDLNDQRFGLSPEQRDELKQRGRVPGPWWTWIWRVQHLWEVVCFFCYRCLEIAARITLMALFAVRLTPGLTHRHERAHCCQRVLWGCPTCIFSLLCCLVTEGASPAFISAVAGMTVLVPHQVIREWYIFAVFGVHAVLVVLLIRLWHGNAEVRRLCLTCMRPTGLDGAPDSIAAAAVLLSVTAPVHVQAGVWAKLTEVKWRKRGCGSFSIKVRLTLYQPRKRSLRAPRLPSRPAPLKSRVQHGCLQVTRPPAM